MPSRARRGVPAQHSSQDEVCANRPKAALKAPPLLSFGGRALLPAPRDLRLRKGSAQRRREASPSAQAGASHSAQCVLGRIPYHMGRRRPPRRRRSSFRWQHPSPGPGGTQGTRGKRAPPYRSPAEAASNARKASQRIMRLWTHSYHLGWRRPLRRCRSSFRWQRPSPGALG